jgi:hypothetical protein
MYINDISEHFELQDSHFILKPVSCSVAFFVNLRAAWPQFEPLSILSQPQFTDNKGEAKKFFSVTSHHQDDCTSVYNYFVIAFEETQYANKIINKLTLVTKVFRPETAHSALLKSIYFVFILSCFINVRRTI